MRLEPTRPSVGKRRTLLGSLFAAFVVLSATPSALASGRLLAGKRMTPTAQPGEPTVDRNTIDTHVVHFGVMHLRVRANGFVTKVDGRPMVSVAALRQSIPHISIGDKASVRIFIEDVAVSGTVAKIGTAGSTPRVPIDIAISSPLPEGTMVDDDVSATIEYGRIESTAYMVWGTSMKENSAGVVFRMEPDGKHAARVNVHFGEMAAELIQITNGLKLGDKVIVSDMTKYNGYPRIKID